MKPETQALATPYMRPDAYGALSMPVYHTAAYEYPDAESMPPSFAGLNDQPDYSRVTNPTVIYYEHKLRDMAGSQVADAVAFTSGMAAITALFMTLAGAGKNIVASPHVFGNTYLLLTATLRRFGVETRLVDFSNPEAVEAAIDGNTACVYLETITNPQLEVASLDKLSAVCRRKGVPLVADTTAIPFTMFDGAKLGIDAQVVSTTKYISGGGTSLGGAVIDHGTVPGLSKRLRKEMLLNTGGYMTPHAAYMQTLGLETLAVRYQQQAATALAVARAMEANPKVARANYPGLESHPDHEIALRQFGPTAGAMLTIDLAGGREECFRVLNRLKLWHRATNLFDNRSLAIHPASTIFGTLTPEERAAMDVLDTTIRLSCGLENADDLIADLEQALK